MKQYNNIAIIILFLLALFLRLYKLPYLTVFNSELAENYLNIKSLLDNPVLLTGQPTSHEWLRLSSIPYYILFPIFLIGNFHPLTGTYFWAILSSLMVLMNYFIIKKIFNEKTALISSLLFAVSPSIITLGRLPHLYNYVIPLTYLFLWWLYRILNRETKKLWPLFLIIGIAINFHFSAIILIPISVLVLLLRHSGESRQRRDDSRINKLVDSGQARMTETAKCLLAFLLPNITFLINDALHGFTTTKNILLWFPYKILNFLKGETYGLEKTPVPDNTLSVILEFFKNSLFPSDYPLRLGFIPMSLIIGSLMVSKVRKNLAFQILFIWLLIGISSLVIHKNPSLHYFMPVYILPVILISFFTTVIASQPRLKKLNEVKSPTGDNLLMRHLPHIFMSSYLLINLSLLFSTRYFYQDIKPLPPYIPYQTQLHLTRAILEDAKGQKYSLTRIGPFDNYRNQFKYNYDYLLWWQGNAPVEKAILRYIIVEEKKKVTKINNYIELTEIENIIVYKQLLLKLEK